jgi:hypothetical protein
VNVDVERFEEPARGHAEANRDHELDKLAPIKRDLEQ